MPKRVFKITYTQTVLLELDDKVIDVVDDEWRKELYDLHTPEQIAEMIGRCMILGSELSGLDGWADQPDENAKIIKMVDESVEAEEVKK